ncbi:hypothetical protein BASA83_005365 [Batrachochytrium salamandrivorans]|nr:hypothetical protein BASA83_005365 [Batrachochytrium salamandrivorans]
MCTATPTGESTRSAMGEFSSRIQKRAPPKEKTPKKKTPKEKKLTSGPDDDEQYARLKTEYEEANQDTHTKCTESKKAELDFHDEAVNMNLNRSGMMTKNSYKASQRVTQHLQLPVETDPIKYVNELRKICKDAKKT